jgi:hypothetical protein
MLAENLHREGLTAVEEARGVKQMLDLGVPISKVAKRTGLGPEAGQEGDRGLPAGRRHRGRGGGGPAGPRLGCRDRALRGRTGGDVPTGGIGRARSRSPGARARAGEAEPQGHRRVRGPRGRTARPPAESSSTNDTVDDVSARLSTRYSTTASRWTATPRRRSTANARLGRARQPAMGRSARDRGVHRPRGNGHTERGGTPGRPLRRSRRPQRRRKPRPRSGGWSSRTTRRCRRRTSSAGSG